MVRLAGLIEGMANSLQVPPSRVRTAAAQLRKHKLLTTGPRGPGAPEMTPKDASNLLLAVLYDGELSLAHETVARLSQAVLVRSRGTRYGQSPVELDTPPRNGFITAADGGARPLGEVIEIMLHWWVSYGTIDESGDEDMDLDPVNIDLSILSPDYKATLKFNTPNGLFWSLHYEWKSPEQIQYELENNGLMVTRWDARNGPHMWSSRSVGEDCLYLLADRLRGCEWREDWEEFVPPYQPAKLARELESA
jgi:hypothetical protein